MQQSCNLSLRGTFKRIACSIAQQSEDILSVRPQSLVKQQQPLINPRICLNVFNIPKSFERLLPKLLRKSRFPAAKSPSSKLAPSVGGVGGWSVIWEALLHHRLLFSLEICFLIKRIQLFLIFVTYLKSNHSLTKEVRLQLCSSGGGGG